MDFPGFVLNTWSIKAFNTLFYAKNRDKQLVVVDYDKYFYPLDGILQWNRMYGRQGFIQYQAAFPVEERRWAEDNRRMLEGARALSRGEGQAR